MKVLYHKTCKGENLALRTALMVISIMIGTESTFHNLAKNTNSYYQYNTGQFLKTSRLI